MCGRYATSRSAAELVDEFLVDDVIDGELEPDYNVAPTKFVWAVLDRAPRGEPDSAPRRQLRALRWGLVPSWAKDLSIGSRLINARTETVAEKPAFRRAFASRRCLLPADGYYEWYSPQDPVASDTPRTRGRTSKQPFFIRPRDGRPLAMAGLYELWRNEERERDDPEAWVWTCTVLTTTAEDDLGRIHDRMPLLVEPDRYEAWLDPARSDPTELLGLLVPAAPGRLEAYPVSTLVNKVDNNGPELIEPIPIEGAPPAAALDATIGAIDAAQASTGAGGAPSSVADAPTLF